MAKMRKPDFETVYETYYDKLYRYAYGLLLHPEDAEDVVEETFFAAYAAYAGYDPARASLATWLTRIAHNKAVDHVRSAACRRETKSPEEADVLAPGDFTQRTEDADTVLWLYARLKREERELLNLRFAMELSDREVAALHGLEVKAVNKRYQRLLAKCRALLDAG